MAFAGLGAGGSASAARTSLPGVDRALVGVVLALIMLGTVMVYSASIALADSPRYNVAPTHFIARHVLSLSIAFCAAAIAFQVPMATWQRLAPWIDPLLAGPLARYRSITAEDVGAALAALCGAGGEGTRIHHHAAIVAAAAGRAPAEGRAG